MRKSVIRGLLNRLASPPFSSYRRTIMKKTVSGLRPFISAFVLVALLGLAGSLLIATWMTSLPNPVAIHWGLNGRPDGFGPRWSLLALQVVFGLLLPLVMLASLTPSIRRGAYSPTARFLMAGALWLGALISVITVGSAAAQRHLTEAADAGSALPVVASAFALATVLAAGFYLLAPKASPPSTVDVADVPVVELQPGERVAWTSTAVSSPWIIVPVLLLAAATLVAGVFAGVPYLLLVSAVLFLMLGTTAVYQVSAGADGLHVRSALGWPRLHVPLADIASAQLVKVDPFQEWGGWGWRARPGGVGVITRRGPAIQVTRTNHRIVVVTAADSKWGVAALRSTLGSPLGAGKETNSADQD